MKKITINLKREKRLNLKNLGLKGIIFAIILAYFVYPSFCLTEMDRECKVVDKVGEYVYYTYDGKYTFIEKRKEPHMIGEMTTIKVKLIDHPKYCYASKARAEKLVLALYTVGMIILTIIFFAEKSERKENGREMSKNFTNFMIVSGIFLSITLFRVFI